MSSASDDDDDHKADETYKPSYKVALPPRRLNPRIAARASARNVRSSSSSSENTLSPSISFVKANETLSFIDNLPVYSSTSQENSANESSDNISPVKPPVNFSPLNEEEIVMGDVEQMRRTFEQIAESTKLNDKRTLPELPFFGQSADPNGKLWIVESMNEFLKHIEKATAGDGWNDIGRLSVIRSKLLSGARDYFQEFSGDTFALAKTYLTAMFPETNTYHSIMSEIEKIKRLPGEQLPYLAIRITKLYAKLKTVAGAELTDVWINKSKKELLLKCVPDSARNFVQIDADTYEALLKKLLEYFETNTQYGLTKADIANEKLKGIKNINNIKDVKGNTGKQNKGENSKGNSSKDKQGNTEGTTVAAIGKGNAKSQGPPEGNPQLSMDQNKPSNPNQMQNNQSQNYNAGFTRRGNANFRGRFSGRGRSRGGRGQRGNPRGGSDYRGYECYRCHRFNHIARDCYANLSNQNQNSQGYANSTSDNSRNNYNNNQTSGGAFDRNNRPAQGASGPVICYKCSMPNHTANNCLMKQPETQNF